MNGCVHLCAGRDRAGISGVKRLVPGCCVSSGEILHGKSVLLQNPFSQIAPQSYLTVYNERMFPVQFMDVRSYFI